MLYHVPKALWLLLLFTLGDENPFDVLLFVLTVDVVPNSQERGLNRCSEDSKGNG